MDFLRNNLLTILILLPTLGAIVTLFAKNRDAVIRFAMAYLQAARCVGLASSKTFASPDQKAMAEWLRAETRGREEFIVEKADEAQRDAQIQANHADAAAKPRLQAELAGACASLRG